MASDCQARPEAERRWPETTSDSEGDARALLYARYRSTFKAALHASAAPSFAWWDHKYLPLIDDLDRAAPILDLGCGDGRLLAYLGRRGFSHAQGIDISAEQVADAQARGLRVDRADAFEFLARHSGAFAAIVAVDVFEHFAVAELMRLGPLVYAALGAGGRLVLQTANGAGLFPRQVIYGDLTHRTIFTPESLQQWLRPCGFADFRFYETGPVPVRVCGRVNVALWELIKIGANAVRGVEAGKHQAIWTENVICVARKGG